MAEAFLYDPNVLKLTDDVYASCQLPSRKRKDPRCEVLTVARALKTASLYSEDNLSIADVKNMMTICFTTAQSCFPCLIWSERGVCYHQMAIDQICEENRLWTVSSADEHDFISDAKTVKGRPKKRRFVYVNQHKHKTGRGKSNKKSSKSAKNRGFKVSNKSFASEIETLTDRMDDKVLERMEARTKAMIDVAVDAALKAFMAKPARKKRSDAGTSRSRPAVGTADKQERKRPKKLTKKKTPKSDTKSTKRYTRSQTSKASTKWTGKSLIAYHCWY